MGFNKVAGHLMMAVPTPYAQWNQVDNGHALHGPNEIAASYRLGHPFWQLVHTYIKPEVAALITSYSQLAPFVASIQALPDKTIAELVDDVQAQEPAYLSAQEATLIKELLCDRKARLAQTLQSWFPPPSRSA